MEELVERIGGDEEAVLINAVKWSFTWKLNSPQSIAWCYDGFPGMGGRVQYVITWTLIWPNLCIN